MTDTIETAPQTYDLEVHWQNVKTNEIVKTFALDDIPNDDFILLGAFINGKYNVRATRKVCDQRDNKSLYMLADVLMTVWTYRWAIVISAVGIIALVVGLGAK